MTDREPVQIVVHGGLKSHEPKDPVFVVAVLALGLVLFMPVILWGSGVIDVEAEGVGLFVGSLVAWILVVLCSGTMLLLRLSRVVVTVSTDRLSVRYATGTPHDVKRSDIGSGIVGKRWVRLRNHQGRGQLWVPLRPRRDKVLAALAGHGWPLDMT